MRILKKILREYIKQKRINVAKEYVEDSNLMSLLDIGCDDKYFLNQFKNIQTTGIDKSLGHYVEKELHFEDSSFNYVTMLAVIEHLEHPKEIIQECARVLKKKGLLIITVPLDNFIFDFLHNTLYSKDELEVEGLHIQSFNKKNMNSMLNPDFNLKKYKLFELGLNQLFVYEKKD